MSKKVLAVDDDPAILAVYGEIFKMTNFEVFYAEDAFGAITKYQQIKPDIVLLDVDMPAGGGMAVFNRLRNTLLSQVPIIFVTGKIEKIETLKNHPKVAFLKKPVTKDNLLFEVVKMIQE